MRANEIVLLLVGLIGGRTRGETFRTHSSGQDQNISPSSDLTTRYSLPPSDTSRDGIHDTGKHRNQSLSRGLSTPSRPSTTYSETNYTGTVGSWSQSQRSPYINSNTFLAAGKGPGIYLTEPSSMIRPMYPNGSKYCVAEDQSCFGQGDFVAQLREVCNLWDSTCSGNRTKAIQEFFLEIIGPLWSNKCFNRLDGYDCGNKINSMLDPVRHWMRSPSCMAEQKPFVESTLGRNITEPCCGGCFWEYSAVELFYWPGLRSGIDTSCLSIIGTSIHPVDYGATTAGSTTYYGCTSHNWITSVSTLTTAILDTQGFITFI